MIKIKEDNKKDCCGCTACMNICPVGAIEMQSDEEGFLYPRINEEKCIDCKLCEKICPKINRKFKNKTILNSYSVRSKDKKILNTSTSGGFFTPIAKYILKNKGYVYGAGYGKKLEVIHKEVRKEEELEELRGSKYVQSNLNNTFKHIREHLQIGNLVLFTGTPCQVEGLKNFLGKEYDNLYTIDLVCHGVPSPKLWGKYVEYQEKRNNSKIKEAYFRNKTYGYHGGTMKLKFENGKTYYGSARTDYMLKAFFKEISSRPSCYECSWKGRNRASDYTIYDCWSYSKLTSKKDDNLGHTNLFVNTKKAKELLEKISEEIEIQAVDENLAIEYDGIMVENSAVPNKYRNEFYKYLNDNGLEKTIQKYIPVTFKDKALENSKLILYKLGIYNSLKKIKNKLKK